ncbi:MAG TPA: hypothetical protein PK765_05965 [bacterium]|nr:hypothetical protein [bacterium]
MNASASRHADPMKTGVPASSSEMLRDESALAPVPDTADDALPESAQSDSSSIESTTPADKAERRSPRRTKNAPSKNAPSRPRIDISQIAAHLHARPAPNVSAFYAEMHQARTISDTVPAVLPFRLPWDTDDGEEYNSLFAASLRKRPKGRKPRLRTKESDVFPEFVPVFVRGMGECDYLTRQKVCV